MFRPLLFCAIAASSLSAAVTLTLTDGRIHIEIDGKPFSDFYYGPDAPKPYLHPLRSASGKIVTRRFPMENVPGESTTDKHHRGVWLGFKSVNGFNFWENEFSYNDKNAGKVVPRIIESVTNGAMAGSFRGIFNWLSPSGRAMLEEDRIMTFRDGGELRIVDSEITLKALVDTTFADSKDGAFWFFAIGGGLTGSELSAWKRFLADGGAKPFRVKQVRWFDAYCGGARASTRQNSSRPL